MLTIVTWWWGDKYPPYYILKLKAGVARYLKQPHRFFVMMERERNWTPPPGIERHAIKDPRLLSIPGCFARLRMFDRGWQINRKIDDRLVCLDLDIVITGPLDVLFNRDDPFTILGGANSSNPCPFNGSVMMLRAQCHEEVWSSFSISAARALPFHEFPDDQGWLAHKIPGAATWRAGPSSGIYAFRKPGWPLDDHLPSDARMVCFPGRRDPIKFQHLPWISQHWR